MVIHLLHYETVNESTVRLQLITIIEVNSAVVSRLQNAHGNEFCHVETQNNFYTGHKSLNTSVSESRVNSQASITGSAVSFSKIGVVSENTTVNINYSSK